jgi:hypothetical protein
MEEEIRRLNNNFKFYSKKLERYKTKLLQQVANMVIQHRIKAYYVQYINNWYNTTLHQLIQRYNILLKQIKDKYEAQQVQYQNNQISAANPDKPMEDSTNQKSAVLIGINYTNTENELYGCVNDAMNLKTLLTTKYKYKEENIKTILNKEATKKTILEEITKLVKEASTNDRLFISYSGHGVSTTDRSGDEADGKDELLVSSDNYAIFDDELKDILDTHLQEGVKLFALFDNCHSGTILDLPYQYFKTYTKSDSDEVLVHPKYKETNGDVVCISGCRDDQESMDAYINFEYTGAMTRSFIDVLTRHQEKDMSWKSLLENMRSYLKSRNFEQVPQLTSGKKNDMSKTNVNL